MATSLGTDKLKVVVKGMIGLGEAFDKSLADDGKLTIGDAGNFLPVIMDLGPILSASSEAIAQAKDLDLTEAAEMDKFVAEELQLSNVKTEAIIEKSLNALVAIYALVAVVKPAQVEAPVA